MISMSWRTCGYVVCVCASRGKIYPTRCYISFGTGRFFEDPKIQAGCTKQVLYRASAQARGDFGPLYLPYPPYPPKPEPVSPRDRTPTDRRQKSEMYERSRGESSGCLVR